MQHLERAQVIVGSLLVGRRLVLAKVDPHANRQWQRGSQVCRDPGAADAVEPEAVDDGVVVLQPEQARPGVAGLWPRRDGAHFRERKAYGRPRRRGSPVFIEPRRKAYRMIERKAKQVQR